MHGDSVADGLIDCECYVEVMIEFKAFSNNSIHCCGLGTIVLGVLSHVSFEGLAAFNGRGEGEAAALALHGHAAL